MKKISLLFLIALLAIRPAHAQLLHIGCYTGTSFPKSEPNHGLWYNDLFVRYESWEGFATECSLGWVSDSKNMAGIYDGSDIGNGYQDNWHLKNNCVALQLHQQYHVFAPTYERLRCYAGCTMTFFYTSFTESYTHASISNALDIQHFNASDKAISAYLGVSVKAELDISKHFMLDLLAGINVVGRSLYEASTGSRYYIPQGPPSIGPAFTTLRIGANYNFFIHEDKNEKETDKKKG